MLAGRALPHALMMMVPEAWEERDDLPEHLRAFYAFHSCLMEPWDGPAAICFTDGRVIGATLDRNGLRPGRWMETKDGWVMLASESGVLDEPGENVLRRGRLQPGKLFLVDLDEGRVVEDDEVKQRVAGRRPYGEWYENGVVRLEDLPDRQGRIPREPLRTRQLAFGQVLEPDDPVLVPLAVGPLHRDALLDLVVLDDPSLVDIDQEQLARLEAAAPQHVLARLVEHAGLRGEHSPALPPSPSSGRPEPVRPCERRASRGRRWKRSQPAVQPLHRRE